MWRKGGPAIGVGAVARSARAARAAARLNLAPELPLVVSAVRLVRVEASG